MGRSQVRSIRALPRAFVEGLPDPFDEAIELPKEEFDKFHKVLRLSSGEQIALLPGDGRLVQCTLQGRQAVPVETFRPDTESRLKLTLALALPKPEKLEESVRMATELGTARFVLFPSDRTVVKWSQDKAESKIERLKRISREAAEVCFRTRLPEFQQLGSLGEVLQKFPQAIVLSEVEGTPRTLDIAQTDQACLVIGPEGGWAPREVELIGDRAASLGARVLRVDTAVAAAVSLALLG